MGYKRVVLAEHYYKNYTCILEEIEDKKLIGAVSGWLLKQI